MHKVRQEMKVYVVYVKAATLQLIPQWKEKRVAIMKDNTQEKMKEQKWQPIKNPWSIVNLTTELYVWLQKGPVL